MLSVGNFLDRLINPIDNSANLKATESTNTSNEDFKDILYSLQPQKQTKDKILTDISKILQDILGFFQNISNISFKSKSQNLDEKIDLSKLNDKAKTSIINILKDIENLSKDINPNFDSKSIESIIKDIKTPKPNESIFISISIQEEISIGKDSKFLDTVLSNLDQHIFSKKDISAYIASFSFEIISQTSNTSKPLFSLKAQKLPNNTLKDTHPSKISINIDIPKEPKPLSEISKQNIDSSNKVIDDTIRKATTSINLTNNTDAKTTSYKDAESMPINTYIHQDTLDNISEHYILAKVQQTPTEDTSNKDNETSHKITYSSKDIELSIELPNQKEKQKDISKHSKEITITTKHINMPDKENEYNIISNSTKGSTSKANSDQNQDPKVTQDLSLDNTESTKDVNKSNNQEDIQKNTNFAKDSTLETYQNILKSNEINQDIKSFKTKDSNTQNKIIDNKTAYKDMSKTKENTSTNNIQNNQKPNKELYKQANISEDTLISKNPLKSDNSNNILETPKPQDTARENPIRYTGKTKENTSTMTKNITKDTNLDTATQYKENNIKNQEQDIKQYIEKNINAINLENKDTIPKTNLNNIHDFANPIKDMIKDVASLQAFNTNTSDKQKDNKDNNQGFNMNYQQNIQNTHQNNTDIINTDKVFKEIEKTVLKEVKNPVLMKNVYINLDDGTALQIKFNTNNLSIAINTNTELVYKDYQIKDLVKNLQSLGFSIENITINGATIESQMGFSENKDQKKDEKEQKENYQTDQSFELVNAV
ncbi:hypothetical protein [Hydrogenobaculum acidophilum]